MRCPKRICSSMKQKKTVTRIVCGLIAALMALSVVGSLIINVAYAG